MLATVVITTKILIVMTATIIGTMVITTIIITVVDAIALETGIEVCRMNIMAAAIALTRVTNSKDVT